MKFRGGARPGARMVWLGGINKIWNLGGDEKFISLWNSTKSGAKTKKMVFVLKTTRFSKKFGLFLQKSAKFLKTWGKDQKKKKGLYLKLYANFHEFLGATTQTNDFCCKIYEKTVLAHKIQEWQPVFWESQTSNCSPVAPSQLIS